MSVGVVVLLESVYIHHDHHRCVRTLKKSLLHVTSKCCMVQKSREWICTIGILPVSESHIRLILLRICQHLQGICT